jgi:hypothetical protein
MGMERDKGTNQNIQVPGTYLLSITVNVGEECSLGIAKIPCTHTTMEWNPYVKIRCIVSNGGGGGVRRLSVNDFIGAVPSSSFAEQAVGRDVTENTHLRPSSGGGHALL